MAMTYDRLWCSVMLVVAWQLHVTRQTTITPDAIEQHVDAEIETNAKSIVQQYENYKTMRNKPHHYKHHSPNRQSYEPHHQHYHHNPHPRQHYKKQLYSPVLQPDELDTIRTDNIQAYWDNLTIHTVDPTHKPYYHVVESNSYWSPSSLLTFKRPHTKRHRHHHKYNRFNNDFQSSLISAATNDRLFIDGEPDLQAAVGRLTNENVDIDEDLDISQLHWPVKKEAIMEGDLILGGLMMVHSREDTMMCGPIMPQGGIQALEAMLFTLDRINRGGLLPNVTIGAHILDDCDRDSYGLEMAVDFIKGKYFEINYNNPNKTIKSYQLFLFNSLSLPIIKI